MAKKNKIKLTKTKEELGGPQYSVTYKANLKTKVSYAILSALIGDRDVVMTVNTDLMFGAEGKEQPYFEKFLRWVKDRCLVYTSRTIPSSKQFSLFGIALKRAQKKEKQAYQIAVYIPNTVWRETDFPECLPVYGAQYYMTKAPMDAGETVARVLDMTEEEAAETFAMDAFDISMIGQIGLNVRDMGEEEIRRALEL